jgi:hypothetical protein
MTAKKKPVPLRDQIIRFLLAKEEATAKQIAAATTERDFPSRVTAELNKLRTDAVVECEKKKGKNELWYWLAAKTSGDSQPAVEQNTGSSAADDSNAPPAAGAAVQPKPAPEAAAPLSADPVAVDEIPQPQYDPRSVSFSAAARAEAAQDENYSLLGVLADIRAAVGDGEGKIMLGELAEHIRGRITLLEAEPAALRREISKADRELDKIRDALLPHVFFGLDDDAPDAVFCAERAAELLQRTLEANREHLNMIAVASETLAAVVHSATDTSDMDLDEIAEAVSAQISETKAHTDEVERALRARVREKDAELLEQAKVVINLRAQLANQTALIEKLLHLLQSARNEAEHLRRHANLTTSAEGLSKYHREIKPGVWIDVYDVLRAWRVLNPALQHLVKKSLQPGERGHKTLEQDLDDIIVSANRAKELEWVTA